MARLDEELLREAEERRRFERAVHEHDPVVSARQRRLAFRILATMGVVAGSAITIGVELLGLSAPSPIVAALGATPLIGVTIGVVVVFRRVFLGTRHNRLIALTVIAGAVGVVLHRFLGVIRGDPTRDIVSGDAFVLALLCALAAVTIRRSLLAPAAFFLTAASIGAYDSRFAFLTIGPAVILTVLVIAFSGDRGSEPLIGHVFGDDKRG